MYEHFSWHLWFLFTQTRTNVDLSNENWVTSSSKHSHEFRLYKTYNFVDYLFEKGDFFKCDFYTGMLDLKKKPVFNATNKKL